MTKNRPVLLLFLYCACFAKTSKKCAQFIFPDLNSTQTVARFENTTLHLRFQLNVDNTACPGYENEEHFVSILKPKTSRALPALFCTLKVKKGWNCSVAFNTKNCWCEKDQAWSFELTKILTQSDSGTWTWKTERTTVQHVDFEIGGHPGVNTTSPAPNVSKYTLTLSTDTHTVSLPGITTVGGKTDPDVATAVTVPVSVIVFISLIIILVKRRTVKRKSTRDHPAPPPCHPREPTSDSFGSMHTHHYFEIDEHSLPGTTNDTRATLKSLSNSDKSMQDSQYLDFIACPSTDSTDSDSDSYAIAFDMQASNIPRVTVHATVHPIPGSDDQEEFKIKTVSHPEIEPDNSAPSELCSKNTDNYLHPVASVFEAAAVPGRNAFLKSRIVPKVTSDPEITAPRAQDSQRPMKKVALCIVPTADIVATSASTSTSECTPRVALAQSEVWPSNAAGSPGGHWTQTTPWVPQAPWMAPALWTTAPWAHPTGTLSPGGAASATHTMRFQDAHDTGPHTNREEKPVATVRTIYTGESAAAFSVRFKKDSTED